MSDLRIVISVALAVLIETLWNVNDDAELISPVRDEY